MPAMPRGPRSAPLLGPALPLLLLLPLTGLALDNGAPNSRLPPLGWSSWVGLGPGWPGPDAKHPAFDFCDEGSVKASVDAFLDVGLYAAGYRHFHLDDCWADLERNASGHLQAERDSFPNGMRPVVDYAHSKGLTFGLYTCAGTLTCVGGRPGSKEHFEQDAAAFAEWGVDWVKMDWCNTRGMKPADTYSRMAAALNQTGRHIHFNMCEWGVEEPWKWGPSLAQSWRSAGDHTGTWASTREAILLRSRIPSEFAGAPYAWNDMDMLESGNYKQAAHANGKEGNMTAAEYRTEFSMWAILASPLVVTTPLLNCSTGACVPSITELQREILLNTEVIAINQDSTPAGRLLSPPDIGDPGLKVFGRHLSDGTVAVALYNPEDEPQEGSVNFALLGWPPGTAASVRDLWAHKDMGVHTDAFPEQEPGGAPGTARVDAHATTVLRLTRAATAAGAPTGIGGGGAPWPLAV